MVDLKHQVLIKASPDKVYAAVGTQTGMRSWWTADTRMEEKAGGEAEFGFEKREVVFRMTIDKLDPGRALVMRCRGDAPEWNGTTLHWEMAAGDDETTILRFTHSGWREPTDFYISCNSMWGNLMFRLKDAVEGNGRGPQWTE